MLNNKKAFCLFGEPHNFADKNKIFSIEFKFAENCQDVWGERGVVPRLISRPHYSHKLVRAVERYLRPGKVR